jgi:hypothetical protein
MSEKDYSTAIIELLDRDSQQVRRGMCYPITRVELLSLPSADNLEGLPKRVFIVEGGKWVEQI